MNASQTLPNIPTRMRNGQPVTAAEGRHFVALIRRTARLRARSAGSKILELIAYAKRGGLTDRQVADAVAAVRNMTPVAVAFARVAIEAARPVVPPRAYTCVDCQREQDLDGSCITCGLPVVATIGRAA